MGDVGGGGSRRILVRDSEKTGTRDTGDAVENDRKKPRWKWIEVWGAVQQYPRAVCLFCNSSLAVDKKKER